MCADRGCILLPSPCRMPPISRGSELYLHLLEPRDVADIFGQDHAIFDQFVVWSVPEQGFQQDPRLQAREMRTEAPMRTRAEGEMPNIFAPEIDLVRVLIVRGIAVGGC